MASKLMLIGLTLVCLLIIMLLPGNLAAGEMGFNAPQECQKSHGLKQCGDQCVNIKVDRDNCGDCGIVCPAGEVCRNGKCVSSPCRKNCSDNNPCTNDYCEKGKCVNEPIMCEQDDNLCTREVCMEGNCESELFRCIGGMCCPDTGCIDYLNGNDPNNCGGCGITCPDDMICCRGSCEYPTGQDCGMIIIDP